MKDLKQIVVFAAMAVVTGCLVLAACKEDPPPPPKPDTHDTRWDDSTGIAISDTLTVYFGEEKWQTLNYDSYLDESDPFALYRWVDIDAHAPGAAYPRVKIHMVLDEGNHSAHMTVNNPGGLGFSVPGRLTGDAQCGYIYYYEDGEIYSPDGTYTADWWPWMVTMSVLEYKREEELLTGRIFATMFDYESWLNREVQSVDSAEQRELIVAFGNLKVNHR